MGSLVKTKDMTALQAQATLNAAEKKVFKELSEHIAKFERDAIWWYWELGLKVDDIYTASEKGRYGKEIMPRLAKSLGMSDDRTLRDARRVVKVFDKVKKNFTEYVKLRGEAGNMLSWSHIRYLTAISDEEQRMQLAAATLEHCWTAEQVFQRVRELCNRESRGRRKSSKLEVPSSVLGMLSKVMSKSTNFVIQVKEAWTGKAFDLADKVRDIPADKLNVKLLNAVKTAQQELSELREQVTVLEESIKAAEKEIAKRMAEQAKLAKAAERAAEETAEEADELLEAEDADEFERISESQDITWDDDEEHETDDSDDTDVANEDDEEDEYVNIGEERNRVAREKRAIERARKKRQAAMREGRVGVARHR